MFCAFHTQLNVICLQSLPNLEKASVENTKLGGYTAFEHGESKSGENPDLVIVATGSEVGIAIDGAKKLPDDKLVRVVSMPSTNLWDAQPLEYRQSVIPDGVPVRFCSSLVSAC